jgi:hypothetical protein
VVGYQAEIIPNYCCFHTWGGITLLVPFLLQSTHAPRIRIGELKDTYGSGENIRFTVNVEGQLEKICNYHTFPEVMIEQMPNEKVVYSNAVPYLGISCDSKLYFITLDLSYETRE